MSVPKYMFKQLRPILLSIYVACVCAVGAASGNATELQGEVKPSDSTKARKVIEIESSERATAMNRNVVVLRGSRLAIGPMTGRLHRSFLTEATTFIDKSMIAKICQKDSKTGKIRQRKGGH